MKELKKRQTARGDAGNIRKIEENSKRLAVIESKIDALMAHLNVTTQHMERGTESSSSPQAKPAPSEIEKS